MDSPSCSPEIPPFSFSLGQSCESNSDSSSPGSPDGFKHMIYTNISDAYDMPPFDNSPASYLAATAGKIPVEYIGSSTLDDRDRRRRRSSLAKDKENVTNMHLRRRAQNRASQRAFRERKEKHVKGLENQLQDLHEKHQDLLHSYTRQAGEVQRLNDRITELTSELSLLRSSNDMSFSEMLTPAKFDLIPYPAMTYSGPEYYFDKDAMKLNGEPSFIAVDDPL